MPPPQVLRGKPTDVKRGRLNVERWWWETIIAHIDDMATQRARTGSSLMLPDTSRSSALELGYREQLISALERYARAAVTQPKVALLAE